MMRSAMSTRVSAVPRASVLAALFVLATVAAPAVDAWLHAGDGAAAAEHAGTDDCVACRLAVTPLAPTPLAETTFPDAMSPQRVRFVPVQAQARAAPARLRPPTRAPPV